MTNPADLASEILAAGHHRLCDTHRGGECDCYWSRKDTFILARAYQEAVEAIEDLAFEGRIKGWGDPGEEIHDPTGSLARVRQFTKRDDR